MLRFEKEGYVNGSVLVKEFGRAGDIHVVLQQDPNASGDMNEMGSIGDRLRRLDQLRDEGLISECEYEAKRRAILNDL